MIKIGNLFQNEVDSGKVIFVFRDRNVECDFNVTRNNEITIDGTVSIDDFNLLINAKIIDFETTEFNGNTIFKKVCGKCFMRDAFVCSTNNSDRISFCGDFASISVFVE